MTALANELVDDVELVSAIWSGRLAVRADDPYHFDHPLDHIPGMALIGGLLELVRRSGAADLDIPNRRLSLSLTFPSFCELDGPVVLQATRIPTGEAGVDTSLSLLAEQGAEVVCEADLTLRVSTERTTPSLWATLLPSVWSYMLAARSRGIGTVWTTRHLSYAAEVAELLDIPSGVHQAALVPTAYYRGSTFRPAPRPPLESSLHVDRW
ncbi:AfsA-related hotdog domain-containing protein [Actinophytocola algeriensis]|uniref:A-factor biosynthesis hotdog domain-containing protein n=1 Tax=Actinophytocola algeriensis TaxID=1768010 RepID=A0A7W7VJN5_9PSEU|nr:AfsA-related hotdog domain-containing protein [Actinophytocola algeriensis]MBB4912852.1 hypothetical protein [Actinophytocola algeriensis]MBE1474114.1 hypothetical protein [Actinophytocola algeriensis]